MGGQVDEAFCDYAKALASCLVQILDDAERRPDAALWNARRAAEALCAAILVREEKKDPFAGSGGKSPDLSELSKRASAKHRALDQWLPTLQHLGNQGAHVRAWAAENPPWAEAWVAVGLLAGATTWFASEAERHWDLDASLANQLRKHADRLRRLSEGPRPKGPRILSSEIEATLREERVARQRLEAQLGEMTAARNAEIATLRAANTSLEARLTESTETGSDRRNRDGARGAGTRARRWLLLGMMLTGVAIGVAVTALLRRQREAGDEPRSSPRDSVAPAAVGSGAAGAATNVPTAVPSAADSAVAPTTSATASTAPRIDALRISSDSKGWTVKLPFSMIEEHRSEQRVDVVATQDISVRLYACREDTAEQHKNAAKRVTYDDPLSFATTGTERATGASRLFYETCLKSQEGKKGPHICVRVLYRTGADAEAERLYKQLQIPEAAEK